MTTHSLNMHTNEEQSDESFSTSFSSTSATSLVSRLDLADSMTKYLKQKSDLSRRDTNSEISMVPLDLAVKEAQSRGSLLDRIASLEDRLLQLCQLIESKAATPSKSSGTKQTFPYTTNSLSEPRKAPFSLSRLRPSLKEDKVTSHVSMDKHRVKEQEEEDLKSTNNEGYMGKTTKKCTSKRATPKARRESPSSWLHFKLLGC